MMQPFEKALPFKTDDAYHGLAEVQGILHIERDHLILEFQIQDSFFGALKSAPKRLRINYLDMSKMQYQRSWFKSKLELKINNLGILSKFPGAKDGRISLKVKRSFKEEAEDIESYVNLRVAEVKLEKLEGEV
ncbi:MAG: hypothetical protein AAFY48_21910 [Bacteroidota bacterium]